MATAKIHKVLALPGVLEANAIYMIPQADPDTFLLYAANSAGTAVKQLGVSGEVLAGVIVTSPTAPDPATSDAMFWWDSGSGSLFVKYVSNGEPAWVEAQPTAIVPQFEGSGGLFGVKDTMARSDHSHESIVIDAEW